MDKILFKTYYIIKSNFGCFCCINALYLCSICVFIYNYLVYLDTDIHANSVRIGMNSDSISFGSGMWEAYFLSFEKKS